MTERLDTPPFSLRPILIPAFGPSVMWGLAEGAALPVIALTARDLGASVAGASFIVALMGVGSLLSNIPLLLSGITAVATLAAGVITNGGIGFAAAAILWYWIPRTRRPAADESPPAPT